MGTEPHHDGERSTHAGPFDVLAREAYGALPTSDAERDDAQRPHRARFEVLGEIARDPTSVLLRGRDLELDREVALKVLEDDGQGARRFLEDAQLGAQLQHPGILPVLGLGFLEDGRAFLALRRVEGETLDDLLARDESPRRLLSVLEQAANALAFAHARGVAHGGLDAFAVVIGRHGQVVVRGWDAAVRTNGDPAIIDEDVRALGMLLELAVGNEVNGELRAMVRRSRSEDPTDRPRRAGDVARAIGSHLAAEETRARAGEIDAAEARVKAAQARAERAREHARALRARRRRRLVVGLAAASIGILAASMGAFLWREAEDEATAARTEPVVREALREAARMEAAGRWAEARAWARKAAAVARRGPAAAEADATLVRIEQAARRMGLESALLVRLRRVRSDFMDRAWDHTLTPGEIASRYEEAFASHGLPLLDLPAGQAAESILALADHEDVFAAIWLWSSVINRERPDEGRRLQAVYVSLMERDPRVRSVEGDSSSASRIDVGYQPPHVLVGVGRYLVKAGDIVAGRRMLEESVRRHPGDAWLRLAQCESATHEAWREARAGRIVDASLRRSISAATTALAVLRPRDAARVGAYHAQLAMALTESGQLEEAARAYERAHDCAPDTAEGLSALGSAHLIRQRLREAVHAYREALLRPGKRATTLFGLARALAPSGHLEEAVETYRAYLAATAAEGHPVPCPKCGGDEVYSDLANVLLKLRRFGEALDAADRAVELEGGAGAHFLRGCALDGLRRWPEALTEYRRAVELGPRYLEAQHNLGHLLVRMDRPEEAIAPLRAAVDLDLGPGILSGEDRRRAEVGARVSLGEALARTGRLDEAIEEYRKAIELDEGLAYAHGALGEALLTKGLVHEAIAALERAVALDPRHPRARPLLARACNHEAWRLATAADPEVRDADEAVALAGRAVELAPGEGVIRNTLGVALYRAGRYEKAIAALEKSIELRGVTDAFDGFFLAMAHAGRDRRTDARQWFVRSVRWMEENAPADEELRRFRAEAEALLKDR